MELKYSSRGSETKEMTLHPQVLEYCRQQQTGRIAVVLPHQVNHEDANHLIALPSVVGIYSPVRPSNQLSCCSKLYLYNPHAADKTFARRAKTILVGGGHLHLTWSMTVQALRQGAFRVVYFRANKATNVSILRYLLWLIAERLFVRLASLSHTHPIKQMIIHMQSISFLRTLWHNIFRRGGSGLTDLTASEASEDINLYRRLLRIAPADDLGAAKGRVLLVNAGLAAGGAERQVVNTLVGLKRRGVDVHFLGEFLDSGPMLNFYRPHLEAAKVPTIALERRLCFANCGFTSVSPEVAELLSQLPRYLIEDILNLTEAFRQIRPEIVHAWQDSTSIKAGIAATIAGVPKIILSGRNVNPTNFAYHQPYMRPAYQALSERDNVVLLNNSEAGVASYCTWLNLPKERYRVLRNGVDFHALGSSTTEEWSQFRRKLGIPDNALVVGAIYRFWPEKRPLLWIDVAGFVARARPDVHFILIGEGPMRAEMESRAKAWSLQGRLHMIGERTNIAEPLGAIDVFLMTSEFEGTPNVALEAQWAGLPVVATEAGGTRESVNEMVTGWICDPTPLALGRQVLALLDNVQMRSQAREAGPPFVDKRFGFNRMIDETMALY